MQVRAIYNNLMATECLYACKTWIHFIIFILIQMIAENDI